MSTHSDGILYALKVTKTDSRCTATLYGHPSGQANCRVSWSWDHSLTFDENMDHAAITALRAFIERTTLDRRLDGRIVGGAGSGDGECLYVVEVHPARAVSMA
jgi:hypothetical protein